MVEEPAEPQKSPEGVLGALEKALDGIKRCERVVDSHSHPTQRRGGLHFTGETQLF